MNSLDFLSNVLRDYCTLHNLEYISADELLYESDNHTDADCYTKLTSDQRIGCHVILVYGTQLMTVTVSSKLSL